MVKTSAFVLLCFRFDSPSEQNIFCICLCVTFLLVDGGIIDYTTVYVIGHLSKSPKYFLCRALLVKLLSINLGNNMAVNCWFLNKGMRIV